jgi:hypothetical protein
MKETSGKINVLSNQSDREKSMPSSPPVALHRLLRAGFFAFI